MILIALGANLPGPAGPPVAQLAAALDALLPHGVRSLCRSRWWRSPAWPDPSDPPFVNAVAEIGTELPPDELLRTLHIVEAKLGRRRTTANAPRPIDLDLIDYHGRITDGTMEGPILPHPRLASRGFVLLPLAEIAPAWRHPATGETLASMIAALPPDTQAEPDETHRRFARPDLARSMIRHDLQQTKVARGRDLV
jgi:2-amino-4-hydroxy-6-hydroxymethyldihydropteridine diphosphokinase